MKTWTAYDLKMGKFEISRGKNDKGEDILTVIRLYQFIDNSGNSIGSLRHQRLVREIPWTDIPVDIKNAFIKLHNYTRSEALKEHNME